MPRLLLRNPVPRDFVDRTPPRTQVGLYHSYSHHRAADAARPHQKVDRRSARCCFAARREGTRKHFKPRLCAGNVRPLSTSSEAASTVCTEVRVFANSARDVAEGRDHGLAACFGCIGDVVRKSIE